MLVFLMMVFAADPPARGSLSPNDQVQGRSIISYCPLIWATERPGGWMPGQAVLKGGQFSLWKVGSAADQSYPVVWNAETKSFWIDRNRDGSISADEKWTLGPEPLEIPLAIDGRARTGLVRVRAGEPLVAIRGFVESQVSIEGRAHKVYLLDGDADGCFHRVGIDRFWIDVDGDGRIDPLVESFLLGTGIEIGGHRYLLKTNGTGEKIEVFLQPKQTGSVRFDLIQGTKHQPRELVLNLISEWGEWVQLRQIDKRETLPVGRYRIVDLEFQLQDENDEAWSYRFFSAGTKWDWEVRENETTSYELLPQLKVHFQTESLALAAGALVKPWIAAANGLTMESCNKGTPTFFGGEKEKSTHSWTGEQAIIRLNEAGSLKLDEQKTGFL